MAEFLLEILSEDIPARMQVQAADDLKRLVTEHLTGAGLTFDSATAHSTPRRLVLVIDGLPEKSPDRSEERKGPKVGAPDGAIQGFLKSAGLSSIDQAEVRETDKGATYFAVTKTPGQTSDTVLASALSHAIANLPWPKSMRWGTSRRKWVRPLHQMVAIFDGRLLAHLDVMVGKYEPGASLPLIEPNIPVRRTTFGHRFLSPEAFEVNAFSDYERELEDHHVVLDREKRKWRIQGEARKLAESQGLVVVPDEALLEEVVGLVEWPVVLMGRIDDDFMDLPPEVRRTTMRANQKYFTLEDGDGRPAPYFLIVGNMETADKGSAIVAGNERVLRARLSDARFFWDQDRKTKLADQRKKLEKIAFHAKLGSVSDRVERLAALTQIIAPAVRTDDNTKSKAFAAAELCKSDLVTGMVGEFPELQGLMGRYYALGEGASEEVADAIRDHYKPLGPNDVCPTEPVSVTLALAEKIDTLIGFFGIGELPTGSKDPFALRRAALGTIRLIVENDLGLSLNEVFVRGFQFYWGQKARRAGAEVGTQKLDMEKKTQSLFGADVANKLKEILNLDSIKGAASAEFIERTKAERDQWIEGILALLPFFADRLKVVLKERGVRHDLVDAVFALGGEDDLVRLLARVRALQDFLATPDGSNLLAAYKRAANILKIEEKRDGASYDGAPDATLLSLDEERALAEALMDAGSMVDPLIAAEDFQGAMAKYAELRPVVDAFFDKVTVNAEQADIRANRLRLLSRIPGTLNKIADFSRIA